jgi:NADPH:quinone reductase-like Zn-dependent oxidoreductase
LRNPSPRFTNISTTCAQGALSPPADLSKYCRILFYQELILMTQGSLHVVRIHRFGGSDVLSLDEVPLPELQNDEILLRIHAASVNPIDFKIRSGEFPPVDGSKLPYPMGRDASGVVERCGKQVDGVAEGDVIFAMSGIGYGTYADYVVLKRGEFAPRPSSLDHAHAAAVPLAALTAWQGLFDHGGLQKGQRVLIHGGAGGVGHMAIQFARHAGAHITVTASARDLDFVRAIGADEAIDYRGKPFEESLKNVDLVYDLVGGATRERSFQVMRSNGIMVSTVGEPSKEKASEYGVRVVGYMAQPKAAQLSRIGELIDDGEVRVNIAKTFSLKDASAAQDFLEDEHVRGKVVLLG